MRLQRRGGSQQSFFQKLSAENKSSLRIKSEEEKAIELIGSVKENLAHILNARKGAAESALSLGLEDFNDTSMGSSDLFIAISNDLRHTIETYEPRLIVENISYTPNDINPLLLNFHLSCKINTGAVDEQLVLDINLSSLTKRFSVQ